jgi:hypothetical protein
MRLFYTKQPYWMRKEIELANAMLKEKFPDYPSAKFVFQNGRMELVNAPDDVYQDMIDASMEIE